METATTTLGYRGRGACVLAGWLHYVLAFFGGAVLGCAIDALLDAMAGRDVADSYYYQYEGEAMAIVGGGAATILGLLMGWRSYRPAHDAANGLPPQPSFFMRSFLKQRHGEARILAELFYARFAILTGEWQPYRTTLLVLAVLLFAAPIISTLAMGRDSDVVLAGYLGGGIAVVLGDCLLVNRITGWRAAGKMTRNS